MLRSSSAVRIQSKQSIDLSCARTDRRRVCAYILCAQPRAECLTARIRAVFMLSVYSAPIESVARHLFV